jgi:L-lactate dehydrogenase complex protein LldE
MSKVHVGLFVPCYIDQLYPQVAMATLSLLEKLGCRVSVPLNQTCCGQPMANSGFSLLTASTDRNFAACFDAFDYIVAPSGSCVLHIKEHFHGENTDQTSRIRSRVFELSEFLIDVLKIQSLDIYFPFRVGFHVSCHGQRGLFLSSMSERNEKVFSKPARLLNMVEGLELLYPERMDECCGFGGTFCVTEEAVSVKMGKDRVVEHQKNEIDVLTGVDVSCLMHLEGILKRKNSDIKVMHLAEILDSKIMKQA